MKRTRDGFSIQIKFGESRKAFNVKAPDEATFEARLAVMQEISRYLVGEKRLPEAEPALRMLAAAGDGFDSVAKGIRTAVAEPSAPARPKGYAGMTFLEFGEEWTSGRLFKRYRGIGKIKQKKPKAVKEDQARIEFVASVVGPVLIGDFTLDHFQAVMEALPADASAATCRAMAQVMAFVLRRAVFPCRARADYPLPEGSLPTVSSQREFQLLYPREEATLMACADVDLFDRAYYGFSVRNGCRKQNFLDLEWRNVDLVNGQCWVPDSKTGKLIAFDLAPGCVRALSALKVIATERHRRAEASPLAKLPDDAKIFPQWEPTTLAKRFRRDLERALGESARPQLFMSTAHQRQIEFHDLRASFITFALANGKSEEWIRERTGHTTSQMIGRYRRERVKRLELHDWLPLDVALGLTSADQAPRPTAPEAEPEASQRHDDIDQERHSPAPVAVLAERAERAPALEVDEGREATGRLLPQVDDQPQAFGEGGLAGRRHELEAALEVGQGEAAAGLGHDAAPSAPREPVAPPGKGGKHAPQTEHEGGATGGATEFLGAEPSNEESSMFLALSSSTPEWTRTTDQLIRNEVKNALKRAVSTQPIASCARSDANARDAANRLPVSSLTASDYERIAELLLGAGEWELLSRVARDRALIEESRETESNVTSLLVERRRRA